LAQTILAQAILAQAILAQGRRYVQEMDAKVVLAGIRGLPCDDEDDAPDDVISGRTVKRIAESLPSGRRKRRNSSSPAVRGRPAEVLNLERSVKHAQRDVDEARHDGKGTATGWNHERLRFGDRVSVNGEDLHCHPNAFQTHGVQSMAWRSVGKDVVLRGGVDGSQGRGLAVVSAESVIIDMCGRALAKLEVDRLVESGAVPAFRKWYDATPSRVRFGALQDVVFEWARYPVWNSDTKRWHMLTYDQYVAGKHGRKPAFGVLDILGSGGSVLYQDPASGVLEGARFFLPGQ